MYQHSPVDSAIQGNVTPNAPVPLVMLPPDLGRLQQNVIPVKTRKTKKSNIVPVKDEKLDVVLLDYDSAWNHYQTTGKMAVVKPMKLQKPDYGSEKYYERELEKAQQAVVRKEMQAMCREQLYADPDSILPAYKCLDGVKSHIAKINGVNSQSLFVLIVVSPDMRNESQSVQNLMNLSIKALKKCWIGEYVLTLEQRGVMGQPEYGTGVHLNFIIRKNDAYLKKAPTDMCREFRNTFRHVIGPNAWNAVDYKYSIDPMNFLHYLAGRKNESHDPEVMEADDEWRKELGLPPYFISNYKSWEPFFQNMDIDFAPFYTHHQMIGSNSI